MKGDSDMGLWWKKVNGQIPVRNAVTFTGDPSTVPKSIPILWRYLQDWHCLQVMDWRDHNFGAGYHLFFSSGSHMMRYRRVLRTRFVMVRVGTEPVTFWVENTKGVAGELVNSGKMVPAHRFRPDRSKPGSSSLETIEALGEIAWV